MPEEEQLFMDWHNVELRNEDGTLTSGAACRKCGAVILAWYREEHVVWHEKVKLVDLSRGLAMGDKISYAWGDGVRTGYIHSVTDQQILVGVTPPVAGIAQMTNLIGHDAVRKRY